MKTLYLDIFSGISGDMFLGALLDLGVDFGTLDRELKRLKLGGYHLHFKKAQKAQITGTKFDVHLEHEHDHDHGHAHDHEHGHHHHDHDHDHDHHDHGHEHPHSHDHEHAHSHSHGHSHEHGEEHTHEHAHEHEHGRNFSEIRELIQHSGLSSWVKEKSLKIFQRVAAAEGKIHGMPPEEVHFHEVGAVDSIIDIVGACIALELLGKPRILAAPVVEGTGWIDCAHGRFPVPAPATLEILAARGLTVSQCDEPHELVTPTGAALLAELVENFGPMQDLAVEKVGFGLGSRDNKTRPNVLRAVLGKSASAPSSVHDWETDTVAVLETNLDDISSEVLGHFVDQALAAGALDVFHTPIQMKKNRPGVLLTVLCEVAAADKFSEMLLKETSAFGVRRSIGERRKLRREFVTAKTQFGDVTVKLGRLDGKVVQAAPEYESCKKVADAKGVPLKSVYEAAVKTVKF